MSKRNRKIILQTEKETIYFSNTHHNYHFLFAIDCYTLFWIALMYIIVLGLYISPPPSGFLRYRVMMCSDSRSGMEAVALEWNDPRIFR